jgi:hypothetical protein
MMSRFPSSVMVSMDEHTPPPGIGHDIGGKHIPTKWHVSLRPDAGVSDDGLVCHHTIFRPLKLVMALRSNYIHATYYEDMLPNS